VRAIIGVFFFVGLVAFAGWALRAVHIGLPPAIAGMIVLTVALGLYGKVPKILNDGAVFLFRIFPLLFIPAIVGVVTVLDIVFEHWLVLLFAVTASSLFGLVAAALIYRLLRAKKRSSL